MKKTSRITPEDRHEIDQETMKKGPLVIKLTVCAALCLFLLIQCAGSKVEDKKKGVVPATSLIFVTEPPRSPLADRKQKASVMFFVLDDCPISNFYAPEMSRIESEYGKEGFDFFFVYADNEMGLDAAKKHLADYSIGFAAVIDHEYELVKATGVTKTPEVAVVAPGGQVCYRGRIDDIYSDLGQRRFQPGKRDLRLALDAIVSGQPVPDPETEAVGCFIPEVP